MGQPSDHTSGDTSLTDPGEDLGVLLVSALGELRRIAMAEMRSQPRGHTLQTTALVNEAVQRLLALAPQEWNSRDHVIATAAKIMRNLLVDHARRRAIQRRERERLAVMEELVDSYELEAGDLGRLDDALRRLAEFNALGSRLVELKFFARLPMAVIAATMGESKRTLEREWTTVRAWLAQELRRDA